MRLWCCFFLIFTSGSCFAYISGIAIQSEKGSNMEVYVNGKLYNKYQQKFVRIRSSPGVLRVELRVFNKYIRQWQVIKKDVRLIRGYDSYYRVAYVNRKAILQEVKRYPVYSKYFLNHSLYNKHPIS
jgi:hypothetical protein